MQSVPDANVPEFEASPVMIRMLRAALIVYWQVSEPLTEQQVQLRENPAIPTGKVRPLNQAAMVLLETLGLVAMALE